MSDCENPKLDFFRRTFLLPSQLSRGYTTRQSCRVIVQGNVRFGLRSESICVHADVIVACFFLIEELRTFCLLRSHLSSGIQLMIPFLSLHSLAFTRTQVYDVTPFSGRKPRLLRHSGHVDATAFFESHEHLAIVHEVLPSRYCLIWDPSPYLGKIGTILGLFKLAAASSILKCPSLSAKLPPGLRLGMRIRPRMLANLGGGFSAPRQYNVLNSQPNEEKYDVVLDVGLTIQLMRSPPTVVKILEAKRF